jgi:hypothetical protein
LIQDACMSRPCGGWLPLFVRGRMKMQTTLFGLLLNPQIPSRD